MPPQTLRVRTASAFHLARALYTRKFFGIRDLVAAVFHHFHYVSFGESKDQINSIRERALGIIKGHSVAEVTAIGEEVYDQVLALRIYPGTRKILDGHLVQVDVDLAEDHLVLTDQGPLTERPVQDAAASEPTQAEDIVDAEIVE